MKELKKVDLTKKNRIAFVASGGAAKALFYHIGVTLALKEYGIEIASAPKKEREKDNVNGNKKFYIEHIVGSSGGAIFAAFAGNGFGETTIEEKLEKKSYLSYFFSWKKRKKGDLTGFSYQDIFFLALPTLKDIRDFFIKYSNFPKYLIDKYGYIFGLETIARELIPFKGLFSLEKLERYLSQVLPINDFKKLYEERGIELSIIACELNNPRKAIFGIHDTEDKLTQQSFYQDYYSNKATISKAVQASCSVPILFKPTIINGKEYIDGETKKCLSTHVAVEQKADLVIVSHVFTPFIENGTLGSISNKGLASIGHQAFQIMMYQKIENARYYKQLRDKFYNFLTSQKFKKKYNLDDEVINNLINDFSETCKYNANLDYIYIPSPFALNYLEYYNILPQMTSEIMNVGYFTANEILPLYGLKKLPEYKDRGILESKNLKKFRYVKSKYEKYKEAVRMRFPKLLTQLED